MDTSDEGLRTAEGLLARSQARPAVGWRSLLLGLAGVIFICGLTPYNDYVVNNTFLVGNFLPVGLLLFFTAFILLVNAPLAAWAPRRALGTGEIAVALCMTLLSCTLPSSGLMRYLPPHLVAYYHNGAGNGDYQRAFEEAHLPEWLFPKLAGKTYLEKANDPVVQQYIYRAPVESDTFAAHWHAVPWSAWARPALTWGILLAALYGAVLCMAAIVRRQWVENERLQFPLAEVYLSLVEAPEPGAVVNPLLRSRRFWIAFVLVFGVHLLNGLAKYFPGKVPEVPLRFDLTDLFSAEPFSYMDPFAKTAGLYFCIIGIAFFLQTKIAFSLWFAVIVVQVARMWLGTYQTQMTQGMETDQLFGGVVVFAGAALWVGRGQWLLILRHMFGRARDGDPGGRYLPYAAAGWGFVACCAGVVVWLMAAGATLAGALVLVIMLMLLFFVIARVVAETGLVFVQFTAVPIWRPWIFLGNVLSNPVRTTTRSFFLSAMFQTIFAHDAREAASVYATQGMRIADAAAYEKERHWRKSLPFVGALALSLLVGYLVAGTSTLYCEYTHASTLDNSRSSPINPYGNSSANFGVLKATFDYLPPAVGAKEAHSRLGHFAFGAALTGLLSILRLRFANWPLHPVGFLLVYSYPMRMIWLSIFVGWLAKVLIVKFGSIHLFRTVRASFMGLILGEAGAAALWLVASLALNGLGLPYYPIKLLPT